MLANLLGGGVAERARPFAETLARILKLVLQARAVRAKLRAEPREFAARCFRAFARCARNRFADVFGGLLGIA
jgi:hypothetical protein